MSDRSGSVSKGTRSRRHSRDRNLPLATITVLVLAFALGLLAFSHFSSFSSHRSAFALDASPTSGSADSVAFPFFFAQSGQGHRVVYPYSVIPGGAHNPEELKDTAAHDPVVGDFYAGFDYDKARVVTVTQPQIVYLSYRIRDKVYWTKKKVALHLGEKLLTDGKITARTRCGNQVSEQVKGAISPQEPPLALLDQPVTADAGTAMRSPLASHYQSALLTRPTTGGFDPLGPPSGSAGLYSPGIGGGFPPISPPALPGGGTNTPNSPPPPPPPPPEPPPAVVPEPGTMLLMASGLAGIYWKRRKLRRD